MLNKALLALGADMKNKFLYTKKGQISYGPEIGDLSDARNYERFKKDAARVAKKAKPTTVACDLHPSYFSTRFGKELSSQIPAVSYKLIQHHHAHIASVLSEHNLKGPVIGVAFDGTGFGTDKNIWGGEFLLVEGAKCERLGQLKYIMMPGGEKVVYEPWRMVLSVLGEKGLSLIEKSKREDAKLVLAMISKNINSPLTSSAGRLFDAAAALLGICCVAEYEAEGPIKLEKICLEGESGVYPFEISTKKGYLLVDSVPLFEAMAKDLDKKVSKAIIATRFHNTLSDIIVKTLKRLSKKTGIKDIALSGGVFQNRFLLKQTIEKLTSLGFSLFTNKTTVNDFNISLGQYYVSCYSSKN